MLGVVAVTAAAVGALSLVGATDLRSDVPAIVPLAMAAAVCGLIAAAMLPTYRCRRGLPPDQVADAGVLRDRSGNILAQLDSLGTTVRIDGWTRGWMRLAVLTWPGGRRTVIRTVSRRRARIVAEFLRNVLSR